MATPDLAKRQATDTRQSYTQRLAHSIPGILTLVPVSRSSVYLALRDGSLRSFKLGKRRLVTDEALRNWIQQLEAAGVSR